MSFDGRVTQEFTGKERYVRPSLTRDHRKGEKWGEYSCGQDILILGWDIRKSWN